MFLFAILLIVQVLTPGTLACMCMPTHPQENVCRKSSFAVLVKIRHEAKVRHPPLLPQSMKLIEQAHEENLETLTKNFTVDENETLFTSTTYSEKHVIGDYLQYHVKIYKVFKRSNGDISEGMKHHIYTPTQDSLCGMKLQPRKTYLIIGSIIEGRLTFGLCDVVIDWKTLSKAEKRNIRDNMKETELMCSSGCNVTSCLWSNCKSKSRNECTWNSDMERRYGHKLNRLNFICVPTSEEHRCDWAGSGFSKINKPLSRKDTPNVFSTPL